MNHKCKNIKMCTMHFLVHLHRQTTFLGKRVSTRVWWVRVLVWCNVPVPPGTSTCTIDPAVTWQTGTQYPCVPARKVTAILHRDHSGLPKMHHPGIEPRAIAWKAIMLPLHQWCWSAPLVCALLTPWESYTLHCTHNINSIFILQIRPTYSYWIYDQSSNNS